MILIESAIGTDVTHCPDCGVELPLRVLSTEAGFYVGTSCDRCGPYSRETTTFRSRTMAELFLRELQPLRPEEGAPIPEGPSNEEPLP